MYRYFLALRYLINRPINLLGMVGIMLGVWALILVVSIFSGYLEAVKKHLQSSTADLTVIEVPSSIDFSSIQTILQADSNVAACSPRLIWYGLLHPYGTDRALIETATPGAIITETNFVTVIGIDPEQDRRVTSFDRWIDNVEDPKLRVADLEAPLRQLGERPAMIISQDRMRRQQLEIGQPIRLTTGQVIGPRGSSALSFINQSFSLAGSYSTTYAGFDSLNVFVHIDALRALLKTSADGTNEIAIKLIDPDTAEATAERLTRVLTSIDRRYRYTEVRTWAQANHLQLSAIDHQRGLMKLVLFVIMVLAAFLMYATLSMMVTEKTHDIGILTALGGSTWGVSSVFLACGLAITVIGSVLGVISGCLSSIYLDDFNQFLKHSLDIDLFPTRIYNLKHVPYSLDPAWIMMVAGTALAVGLVVSGLPAWRAARHDPLQSLRRD